MKNSAGAEPHDREVALEAAARVEHRRVDHPADRHVDLVGAQPLQHGRAHRGPSARTWKTTSGRRRPHPRGTRAARRARTAASRACRACTAASTRPAAGSSSRAPSSSCCRTPRPSRPAGRRAASGAAGAPSRAPRAASASRSGGRASRPCGRRGACDWRGTARSGACRRPTGRAAASPSTIHSATSLPAPPALAMPAELNPAQTKNPASSGASPRMKLPSSVKLSGPFSSSLTSAVSRHGVRWIAFVIRISKWSQSSGSSWNSKPSGIGSTFHGFAFGSKPPITRPPTSSL